MSELTLRQHRRTTLDALRRDFPRWGFVYHEESERWFAAPGHALTPALRVLRSSQRIEAGTAGELRAMLEALPGT